MTEIVAPGGSFEKALYAFRAGAHAVYIGLKSFSARTHSANFSIEQLRKLKSFALANDRKIYVAINTIVKDSELEALIDSLYDIALIGVDGVIVQDIGVIEVIKTYFPGLSIHASTQMAVHNVAGVAYLKNLGVKRVVLSREVPFEDIKKIQEAHPDMQLEVFVHGALCYSFSGLCLASALLCGRSGNRGDCAQICRNSYHSDDEKGCYFSCNDLCLGEEVLKLKDIGVSALKIEGRMKSPEYVFNTVVMYADILSGGSSIERAAELKRASRLSFGREETKGYFYSRSGEHLIDSQYAMHRGVLLGTVISTTKNTFTIKVKHRLHERDGLMFFVDGDPSTPKKFSAKKIKKNGDGEQVIIAEAGSVVTIGTDIVCCGMVQGQELYHLSSRLLDLPTLRTENSIDSYQRPMPVEVAVANDALSVHFSWDGEPFEFCEQIEVFPAKNAIDFTSVLKKFFTQSNKNPVVVGDIALINNSDLPANGIFLPPAAIKKFKNSFYTFLNTVIEKKRAQLLEEVLQYKCPADAFATHSLFDGKCREFVAQRERLNPAKGDRLLPFVSKSDLEHASFASQRKLSFLPLPPVIFEENVFFRSVEAALVKHPEKIFLVGLNNIHHLYYAEKLQRYDNVFFFVDFYLYAANRFALKFYQDKIGKLLFAYRFIEDDNETDQLPLTAIGRSFNPPLFYSCGCFCRHNVFNACPKGCKKHYRRTLINRKEFSLITEECISYLFEKNNRRV
jgi:U32 family peptidase